MWCFDMCNIISELISTMPINDAKGTEEIREEEDDEDPSPQDD